MDYSPIWISLKTASVAIVITVFLGIFLAKQVYAMQNRRAKALFDSLLTLPMVLPPTVAGYFLLSLFGIQRPVGKFLLTFFGVKIVFSWKATVIAAVFIALPLMYRSARASFEQVDDVFVQAGRTLGMSEWAIFRKILLPLALPGLASGAVLSFARALGEFGATAMLAGNIAGETRTLPLAIYSAVASGDASDAKNDVLVLLCLSFLIMALLNFVAAWHHKLNGKEKTR